jgi:uncharacterized membrane protein YfcA
MNIQISDLSTLQWLMLGLCAFLIGISKTGVPGLGILVVPIAAAIFPSKASTGLILPMLILADIFAVAYYKRHAVWSHLIRLIPWAMLGIVLGYLAMGKVNDAQLKPIIGVIVLLMLGLGYWRTRRAGDFYEIPTQWWFAAIMGLFAGTTTMLANAAGPIMAIYLIAMRLPKNEYLGTGAWYFLLMNCFKVPFSADQNLINHQSLLLNLANAPIIMIGSITGIMIAKHIPEKTFTTIVQLLAALAAACLIIH